MAQPVSAPARPGKCEGKRHSWDGRTRDTGSCSSGDGESSLSPGGFLGCSATSSSASSTQTFRAVLFVSDSQGGKDGSARDTVSTPRPPLLSRVGSRIRSEDAMPSPVPPAQPWSQVSVVLHTQTPLRDALPFESGPCATLRCPTAGTSVAPLGTIRLGYTTQVQGHSVHLCVEQ